MGVHELQVDEQELHQQIAGLVDQACFLQVHRLQDRIVVDVLAQPLILQLEGRPRSCGDALPDPAQLRVRLGLVGLARVERPAPFDGQRVEREGGDVDARVEHVSGGMNEAAIGPAALHRDRQYLTRYTSPEVAGPEGDLVSIREQPHTPRPLVDLQDDGLDGRRRGRGGWLGDSRLGDALPCHQHVAPRCRVPLAGLLHPQADEGLEITLLGHAESPGRSAATKDPRSRGRAVQKTR